MGRGLVAAALIAWSASGCAVPLGGASIAHDETQVFRAPHFDWARMKAGGVALVGVTSTVAPEGIRDDVGFVLDQAAANHLSRIRVVPRGDVAARAREAGMSGDLVRLMRDYEQHGTVDAGLLRRFASVEGVRYFLVTRIIQYERITRTVAAPSSVAITSRPVSPPKRATERVQRVRLRGDVWDSRCGDIVWTGEGGTEAVEETATEDIRLQDVLAMAASNLVTQLPRANDAPQAQDKECGA